MPVNVMRIESACPRESPKRSRCFCLVLVGGVHGGGRRGVVGSEEEEEEGGVEWWPFVGRGWVSASAAAGGVGLRSSGGGDGDDGGDDDGSMSGLALSCGCVFVCIY